MRRANASACMYLEGAVREVSVCRVTYALVIFFYSTSGKTIVQVNLASGGRAGGL